VISKEIINVSSKVPLSFVPYDTLNAEKYRCIFNVPMSLASYDTH